jgi:peptidyl-dipeptidase A
MMARAEDTQKTPRSGLLSTWPSLHGSQTTQETPEEPAPAEAPAASEEAQAPAPAAQAPAAKPAPAPKPAKPAAPKPAPVPVAVPPPPPPPPKPEITAADAAKFVADVNAEDKAQYAETQAAYWLSETFINDDTQLLNAKASDRQLAMQSRQIEASKKFNGMQLPSDVARQLLLLKISNPLPAPSDAARRAELAALATRLNGEYGAAKYCPPGKKECLNQDQLEDVLDHSRDAKALAEAWAGWHSTARPTRAEYQRMVALMNEGAQELGYKDTGELWRAGYDMSPAEFEAETERLWNQVKPLYTNLQCYVRDRLTQWYPNAIGSNGLIPADLLGNMWAQDWSNIYDLVQPYAGASTLDVTSALQKKRDDIAAQKIAAFRAQYAKDHPKQEPSPGEISNVEQQADTEFAKQVAKISEDFYTSIGFPALPASFYEKSMLTRPRDRDVVCHAEATDMDLKGDLRVKMCIKPDEESLDTIHHELGHVYYYMMYNPLPFLYQNGAHDGFHEAIGDTITLSLNPDHLVKIGLLKDVDNSPEAVVNAQMKRALSKIAFLPFGKLIDQWRWKVFSGEIKPADYNKAWWQLREKYQGVKAPVPRSEADFDPGAKYHIPGNTPYTRYFLSFVIQFQFQKALCDAAGFKGPLYACDIYNNKAAGQKYMAMLKQGASEPWQDTLYKLTGTRQMDASAIIEYFQPLMTFLQQQNAGKSCGWSEDNNPLEASAAPTPLLAAGQP